MTKTSSNESLEQRMRLIWFALKFGVILAAQEVRVVAKLDQFGEVAIR
jgi:hypothetical protein